MKTRPASDVLHHHTQFEMQDSQSVRTPAHDLYILLWAADAVCRGRTHRAQNGAANLTGILVPIASLGFLSSVYFVFLSLLSLRACASID